MERAAFRIFSSPRNTGKHEGGPMWSLFIALRSEVVVGKKLILHDDDISNYELIHTFRKSILLQSPLGLLLPRICVSRTQSSRTLDSD